MSGAVITKPKNTNLLQPTKYSVSFPEISDTIYFCQKINLPGVSLSDMPQVTPNLDLFVPSTKLMYNTLDLEFLVNENLSSWIVIHNWIRNITTNGVTSNLLTYKNNSKAQAILTVYSNQNNPRIRVNFSDVFPLTLGDIEFDTTLSAEEHLVARATFRFNYFDIITI